MNQDTAISNPLDDPRLASAVFFPRPDQPFGPTLPGVRDHMVKVPDACIRIREFPGAKEAPVILFFRLRILARLMPLSALLTGCAVFSPAFQSAAAPPAGPLRIHPENPRYFTDGASPDFSPPGWCIGNPGSGKTAPGQGETGLRAFPNPRWRVDTLLASSLTAPGRGFAFLARIGASLDDIGFALSKTW
jgi:hypothetical protein